MVIPQEGYVASNSVHSPVLRARASSVLSWGRLARLRCTMAIQNFNLQSRGLCLPSVTWLIIFTKRITGCVVPASISAMQTDDGAMSSRTPFSGILKLNNALMSAVRPFLSTALRSAFQRCAEVSIFNGANAISISTVRCMSAGCRL